MNPASLSVSPPSALELPRRSPDAPAPCGRTGRRLWRAGIGLGLAILIFLAGWQARRIQSGEHRLAFGHDLLPSYTAGYLLRTGRPRELFDRTIVQDLEAREISSAHLDIDPRYGPWLNPPFFAWVFAPLSALPYRQALGVFVCFNLALLVGCLFLLRSMLIATPRAQLHPSSFILHPAHTSWTTLALVPLLLATSMPFMQAFGHQQNTFITLMILCATVAFWRQGNAFTAGLMAGLLAFKPQHAVLVCAAVGLCMGWRAIAGVCMTGLVLLAITLLTLPGCLDDFLHKMPPIVAWLQNEPRYNWGRQVTFQSFWRLLLQGKEGGPTWRPVLGLAWGCSGIVAAALGAAMLRLVRARKHNPSPDRVIAAVIASAPLIMPYYMDYDLVLLVIPAVLFASQWLADPQAISRRDRCLLGAWVVLFAAAFVNPGFAREFRVNLTVPALVAVAGMHIARCFQTAADDSPTLA